MPGNFGPGPSNFIFADRVREITLTQGIADFVLGGTPPGGVGYVPFSSVMVDQTVCDYCCQDPLTDDWEVGVGTYVAVINTILRGVNGIPQVQAGSNGTQLVNFGPNAKDIFLTVSGNRYLNWFRSNVFVGAVYAGPSAGGPYYPQFRRLVGGDLPLMFPAIPPDPASGFAGYPGTQGVVAAPQPADADRVWGGDGQWHDVVFDVAVDPLVPLASSGGPLDLMGTITISSTKQPAARVWAGPPSALRSGDPAEPTPDDFMSVRLLVDNDMPKHVALTNITNLFGPVQEFQNGISIALGQGVTWAAGALMTMEWGAGKRTSRQLARRQV